ncbi:Flp pilus assembly protein CpaB [Qipengyuania sp. 1NDW9]|uniref:Flp pilus assembly protein CpaB n=1 Tax=Qipengyuania TaxID=1855416 RepID=UPI001C8693E7|nr:MULTISPECIES: Flp pilus assembly protein CpaB [Qipengyuania]MBX7494094.1 Flp pilus assembly protein CpaB [Qipengyuania xiapuensis]MBY6127088.1 Flp pilus assembly protein CpaB [Qipengyuania aquimaris]
MRGRNLIILGIAIVAGLFAVYLANAYFSSAEEREERRAEELRMARIAVATQDVAFGQPITETNTRLVNWPAGSVPVGAFTSTQEAIGGGRVALRPITVGEPILASKVSGDDGRATLASNLPEDMRAVAIPVNNVAGVGGFVRPGDVVDVILTRQIPGDGAQTTDKMTTVVLENVLVLAADLIADESQTQPVVTQTATLQTDLFGAQKLALAREIGTFTLALRNVENQTVGGTETVVASDLGGGNRRIYGGGNRGGGIRDAGGAQQVINLASARGGTSQAMAPRRPRGPTMSIVRGTEAETYEVER